jgi:hypothetical protein
MRLFAIVAVLGIQFSHPAPAADHREAPALNLEDVVFEGSGPVFDADGKLVAVDRVRLSGVTADGHEVEASGELSLHGQHQDNGDPAKTGIIDDILGRLRDITDGTSKTFTGRAQVGFDSISVDDQLFAAIGGMRLHAHLLEPALVREFDIEALAVPGNDGRWSARFHGADRLGLGVRIDGFYDSRNQWGVWDDTEIVHLRGDVEALALLDSAADPLSFEDKAGQEQFVFDDTGGAEQIYFVYDDWGRLSDIEHSAEIEGRFTARLTLRVIGHDAASHDGVLNIQVGDVILSQSGHGPDGKVSGRAEFFFSGVGSRDGVEVTVSGTAGFGFQGDVADGNDWFMASGELRILSATLEDAETGGTLLFEDISGKLGQARIVGTIDPSGMVDLAGGLGQITQVGLGKTVSRLLSNEQ